MTHDADIIIALETAANTTIEVGPAERRRLLMEGMNEATLLEARLRNAVNADFERPDFLDDMTALIEMAANPNAVEILVAAGMSMLASEIERMRGLLDSLPPTSVAAQPTLAEALEEEGFRPFHRDRKVIGQGRVRRSLKPRKHAAD